MLLPGDHRGRGVSIPNGKPILFRLFLLDLPGQSRLNVSIPNGKPILFRLSLRGGSPLWRRCFNPKREAHPLQTVQGMKQAQPMLQFQSQTGSPSSSDCECEPDRLPGCTGFNPKREAHPLQTLGTLRRTGGGRLVSIPNGKPILFRHELGYILSPRGGYVSIPNGKPILFRRLRISGAGGASLQFQSQTGSPSSSDEMRLRAAIEDVQGFNPKREAHPLQTHSRPCKQNQGKGFNPKREAHPLQTWSLTR